MAHVNAVENKVVVVVELDGDEVKHIGKIIDRIDTIEFHDSTDDWVAEDEGGLDVVFYVDNLTAPYEMEDLVRKAIEDVMEEAAEAEEVGDEQ